MVVPAPPQTPLTASRAGGATPEAEETTIDKLYDLMMGEETEFVSEIDKLLTLHEQQQKRKRQSIHHEFESEIHDRVQQQISLAVSRRSVLQVEARHRQLMDEFLDVSNRKAKAQSGVFRDIIIPAEYDPLHAHELSRISYNPRTSRDPCKLELRKHEAPSSTRVPEYGAPNASGTVPRLEPQVWSKLESTPYGRLGKVVPRPDMPPYRLSNRVTQDEFNVPLGYEHVARELARGKKCFPEHR